MHVYLINYQPRFSRKRIQLWNNFILLVLTYFYLGNHVHSRAPIINSSSIGSLDGFRLTIAWMQILVQAIIIFIKIAQQLPCSAWVRLLTDEIKKISFHLRKQNWPSYSGNIIFRDIPVTYFKFLIPVYTFFNLITRF